MLAPAWVVLYVSTVQAQDELLHPVFSDHVVLQRDAPVVVRGNAEAGETVTVRLGEQSETAQVGADGKFSVELPAPPTGGPYELVAETSTGKQQQVRDVLVGDVFLCSGQSNMEWPVRQTERAEEAIESSANDRIRMLKVPLASSAAPLDTFASDVQWELASPETVGGWSAVCYYFAREVQPAAGVPIGLINASWGGSDIRSWMSASTLADVGGYEDELALLELYANDKAAAQTRFAASWETWWRDRSGDAAGSEPWQPDAGSGWPVAPKELGDWKQWGVADLSNHNGMLWHRATFNLDEHQAASDGLLALGGIDEVDQTWINGEPLGNTFGWGTERTYPVPAELLREGENVVIVNVLNTYGQGGLVGDASGRAFLPAGVDSPTDAEAIPLGSWQYEKVPLSIGFPPRTPWESVGGRTTIHNAMVAPLGEIGLAGALWYQGESNTGEGRDYEALMKGLMEQWREQSGDPELPVLIVQLANYGSIPSQPVESGWSEVREAQRLAAVNDPDAAYVVTIDIGNPMDIHPREKWEVGRRLARAARNVIYGEDVAPSGPAPVSARKTSDEVVVTLDDIEDSLQNRAKDEIVGFELCGTERGSCETAMAQLEGDTVVLTGANQKDATRVRYCWGDSPECYLFDEAGLPLTPFEIAIE